MLLIFGEGRNSPSPSERGPGGEVSTPSERGPGGEVTNGLIHKIIHKNNILLTFCVICPAQSRLPMFHPYDSPKHCKTEAAARVHSD